MSDEASVSHGEYFDGADDCYEPYFRDEVHVSNDYGYAQHEDDGEYAHGEWAFEEGVKSVEIAAAIQTRDALLATDQALYSYRAPSPPALLSACDAGICGGEGGEVVDSIEMEAETKGENEFDGGDEHDEKDGDFAPFDYDRYYQGIGYEAHRDAVDEAEIAAWHSKFQYLRIEGVGIKIPEAQEVIDYIDMIETDPMLTSAQDTFTPTPAADSETFPVENECELFICGKKAIIHPTTVLNPDEISLHFEGSEPSNSPDEDPICFVDGVLEEYIDLDRTTGDGNALDDTISCLEPEESMREEVISSLIDVIWPDLVEALSPLIERMTAMPVEEWRARAQELAAMKTETANEWCSDGGW